MSTSRTDVFPGDPGIRLMVAAAFLRADDDEALGTNHLLIALTNLDATRGPLAAAGLTRTVALTVNDRLLGRWTSADATGVGPTGADPGDVGPTDVGPTDAGPTDVGPTGPHDIVIADGGAPVRFNPAAAEALHRAATVRTVCTPADVLLALLEDPGNRATELLATCGIPAAALYADLAAGRTPAVRDDVDPALRQVRDRLIGRSVFRSPGWRRPMTAFAIAVRINYGRHPLQWIRLEAAEQAHSTPSGPGGPDSADILLAVAATYEVAQRLPYLVDPDDPRFRGAALLQAAGVTYERLRPARPDDRGDAARPGDRGDAAGPDDRGNAAGPGDRGDPVGERLSRRMLAVRYPDTLALVRDLLAVPPPSRAAQLLTAAGFDVTALRRALG
ncbi:Clp protease N-terminal domain-containing protein [Nucisporomicrobium flavum]|uniref:Clp protease N-terminal domain-containing protein n=1 Tax=Nucisporomicrobium flavum TaxID=2785915 RepID=UPI003C2B6B3D